MSSGDNPNASPCLSPSPAPNIAITWYRSGSAWRTASTWSCSQGTTFRAGASGRRTDPEDDREGHRADKADPTSSGIYGVLVQVHQITVGARLVPTRMGSLALGPVRRS